ncbi:MAG TPA: J domain-containing protein [Candidatus Limnocylindrales bacterium]|jgi:hypothetical protein|nr:J domain-containing protein [Candidatus Limnocylindrales bacterium]
MRHKSAISYYRALGLSPGASAKDVRRAYIELVKKWHPDRFAQKSARDQAVAQEKVKEINEAYHFLREHQGWYVPPAPAYGRRDEWSEYRRWADYAPPTVDPFEGDYQYRPVRASRANPLVWGTAFVLLSFAFQAITGWNVFTGRMPPANSVQAAAEPASHSARVRAAGIGGLGTFSSNSRPEQLQVFFVGSAKADVYRVQGMPNWSNEQEWRYGSSRIYFRNGIVERWESHSDFPLKTIEVPAVSAQSVIDRGATIAEVLAIQGVPKSLKDNYWAYPNDQVVKTTYWQYGKSQIEFSDGKVIGWKEAAGEKLRVRR